MNRKALERAIRIAGSQAALARLLGTSQQNVHRWLKSTRKGVPPEFAPKIENATGGKVTRHQLRPDVFT